MDFKSDPKSVMIVSSNENTAKSIAAMLPPGDFYPVCSVTDAGRARREFVDRSADIVIINSPLPDEFGADLAVELAQDSLCGVLIFVRSELFESVCDKVEQYGVLTVIKPAGRQIVIQGLHMLVSFLERLKDYRKLTETLEAKMSEIRLVNRAKLLLVEHLKMSEQDSHRYIEKAAMDGCIKRSEVAKRIIKTYEEQ